jgi:hypothetical protein
LSHNRCNLSNKAQEPSDRVQAFTFGVSGLRPFIHTAIAGIGIGMMGINNIYKQPIYELTSISGLYVKTAKAARQ